MRFNVFYITVLILWLNGKNFSTFLRPFGQYLYGFRALDRLFDPVAVRLYTHQLYKRITLH